AAFRARAIPIGRVLSSQWCRCLETARLAFGEPTPWPALNSTFRNRELEPERTREVRALAGERPAGGNLVLVTHQLNIAALTSVYPAEGELVVLSPLGGGRFRVTGRLQPDALNQGGHRMRTRLSVLAAVAPPAARVAALASLALGTGVIACGRLLAHF